jgi:hypothetical protein
MLAQQEWRMVYRDKIAALFARAGSPAAALKGIPVEGDAGSNLVP